MKLFRKIIIALFAVIETMSVVSCSKEKEFNAIAITDCSRAKVDIDELTNNLSLLNNRPRKCNKYLTPLEVLNT